MGDKVKNIGIIGAGVIGTGVAHCLVEKGFNPVLVDVSDERLQVAKDNMKTNIGMQILLGRNKEIDPD